MTYMTATVRLPDGKIYGIYAHYSAIMQVLREQSVDCIREAIEDAKKRGVETDYELEEDVIRVDYWNCVIVDFKSKRAIDVMNGCFDLQALLPGFKIYWINLLQDLHEMAEELFEEGKP